MKHTYIYMLLLTVSMAFSCAKESEPGKGRVVLTLSGDNQLTEVVTKGQVSDYVALPSADDFYLKITDETSSVAWEGMFSEWDEDMILLEGQYNASASFGSLEEEGFGKPFFFASKDFNVTGGQTVEVGLTATLSNTIVKVVTTENFRNSYDDWSFSLSRSGTVIAQYEKDDVRGAFIDGYLICFDGVLSRGGKTYTLNQEYTSLAPATAYTVTVDTDNAGRSSILIKFNDEVEVVDLGDLELNE